MLQLIEWHIPGRVLLIKCARDLMLKHYTEAITCAQAMIAADSQPPNVHVILDLTAREAIDLDLLEAARQDETLWRSQRLGWLIIADPQPHPSLNFAFSSSAQRVAMQSLSHPAELPLARFCVVSSVDAALNFLKHNDPTLNRLQAIS